MGPMEGINQIDAKQNFVPAKIDDAAIKQVMDDPEMKGLLAQLDGGTM